LGAGNGSREEEERKSREQMIHECGLVGLDDVEARMEEKGEFS
jgi:hypothetical protein